MMFTSRTQNIYYAQFPCQLFHREVEKRNWTEPKRHINWRRSRKKRTQMKSECVCFIKTWDVTTQNSARVMNIAFNFRIEKARWNYQCPINARKLHSQLDLDVLVACRREREEKKWKEIESPRLNCYFVDSLLITRGKKWILLLNLSAVSQCQCECRKKNWKEKKWLERPWHAAIFPLLLHLCRILTQIGPGKWFSFHAKDIV